MKYSRYGSGNTKFDKLTLKRCKFSMWDTADYSKAGCGATALGLLTGEDPLVIKKRVRGKDHYSDRYMTDFLRNHNFSVYEVNRANLTNKNTWRHSLLDNHLLLYSLLVQKKEATWFVAYNNYAYHNFEVVKRDYIDFINFPIESMYVLHKKDWA